MVSFSFGSPLSASAVSKPIFYIKATEDKAKFLHLYFLDQEKMSYPLVLWLQGPHQKPVVLSSLIIIAQADQKVLSLYHQKGEVNSRHCPKSRHSMLVVSYW